MKTGRRGVASICNFEFRLSQASSLWISRRIAQSFGIFGFLLVFIFALLVLARTRGLRLRCIGCGAGFNFDVLAGACCATRSIRVVAGGVGSRSDRAGDLLTADLLGVRENLIGLQVSIDQHTLR